MSDDSILEINFWYSNVDSLNVEFIRGYNRYRVSFSYSSDSACGAFVESASGLVLFVCLFLFLHQNWSPEEKNRVLVVGNLRPFVSPWRPLQGVCPAPGSFGI